jgi:regulator of replication initiation timing
MLSAMQNQTQIHLVIERVERLLVRYSELQRTNTLLVEQLSLVELERDTLKSRLGAVRARVDALLERLPDSMTNDSLRDPA